VHKSDFTAAFDHVCTTYSAAGHPVTNFMTDTDSVMTSEVFRDKAVELNVGLRLSSPYCHWQNGIIERFVYSVKNKTICNLFSSRLPQCWWYPSLRHASDTYNATPTRTNPCQASPRDVWHGKLSVGVDGEIELATGQNFQILVSKNIYILDPALFLRYSQYKLAPTRQMRPPGGQGTHKAIQPRRHPGFLPPHRTIADLANFFPPSPMDF
jgi:hypothetical protein